MVDKTPAELDAGITSDTSVIHASENDVSTNSKKHNERDISRLQGTTPIYSSSKTYNVNDLVTESDIVYRCISSIIVPEVFNLSNWSEINAEDVLIFARNVSGVSIPKGSAVYITGEDSGITAIDLALASGLSTVPSIGLTQSTIANNNTGEVVYIGKIVDIDTSTFSAGDVLFLSETTPGELTATAPAHPNLRQSMAVVLVSDASVGELEVITGDLSGAETGTLSNSFAIGDGLAGTKTLSFFNDVGTFSANALFTASRAQSFQDADGTIALTSDVVDTTASNVGSGDGVFKQKVGSNLEFKTLIETSPISIANNSDDLTFTLDDLVNADISAIAGIEFSKMAALTIDRSLVSDGSGIVSASATTSTEIGFVSGVTSSIQTQLDSKVDTVTNLGAGEGIGASIVGDTLNLKSLVAGTNIGLVGTVNDITVSTTAEANTASNVGTGEGWFKQKTGIDLEFKSIIAGFGIDATNNTDDITLEVNEEEIVQRFREKRQIFLVPSDDTNFIFGGLGAGTFTQEGTSTGTLDADGFYITFAATGGMGAEPGGIFITDSVRRDLNFNIETKFRLNDLVNADFILGFFELDPIANGFDNNEHIALIRDADGANTNFLLSHCDGIGAATQTQIAVADTNIHTFLTIADDANSKFQTSFDGSALTDVTTNIPASTTNLILFGEVIDGGGGGSLNADFWYLEGFADA